MPRTNNNLNCPIILLQVTSYSIFTDACLFGRIIKLSTAIVWQEMFDVLFPLLLVQDQRLLHYQLQQAKCRGSWLYTVHNSTYMPFMYTVHNRTFLTPFFCPIVVDPLSEAIDSGHFGTCFSWTGTLYHYFSFNHLLFSTGIRTICNQYKCEQIDCIILWSLIQTTLFTIPYHQTHSPMHQQTKHPSSSHSIMSYPIQHPNCQINGTNRDKYKQHNRCRRWLNMEYDSIVKSPETSILIIYQGHLDADSILRTFSNEKHVWWSILYDNSH